MNRTVDQSNKIIEAAFRRAWGDISILCVHKDKLTLHGCYVVPFRFTDEGIEFNVRELTFSSPRGEDKWIKS